VSFKLRIPGRDDIQAVPAANLANPLILTETISRLAGLAANDHRDSVPPVEPISRLAGLADMAKSIDARQLAADLLHAAMKVCDRHGDNDTARQEMRDQCLALPPHLQVDLLKHFTGKRRNFTGG
jgi:hypothetical protein